jgi:hypothetical protein
MIWNIQQGKLLNTIQAHKTGVTAMRLFKGKLSEFRRSIMNLKTQIKPKNNFYQVLILMN